MRHALLLLLFLSSTLALSAERFSIVVYNVENLFDVDGVALYDDYQPTVYNREHFLTKLTNTTALMRRFNSGRGPDIILFQEIEADQTPDQWSGNLVKFLTEHTGVTVEQLLREKWNPALAGVPAHVWLYKTMVDAGTFEYFVAVGDDTSAAAADRSAVVNVTFSRFPIVDQRLHPSPQARPTLETRLDIGGHPLYVFNVHWKSGASNEQMEPIRIENARVVRQRIDQILKNDPHADIVLGGDFNSQYNQSTRFPRWRQTAVNGILGSQGDELALRNRRGPDLYNLWFEVPPERRGSDIFRGQWGTLMQVIISRGLYDYRGVQYMDNSFGVAIIPGKNADPVTGLPIRWTAAGNGAGYSDHFPIYAWFQTVNANETGRWMTLENPSRDAKGSPEPRTINFADAQLEAAPKAAELGRERPLRERPEFFGRTLHVEGRVSGEFPFRITVGEEEFQVWSHDEELRRRIYAAYSVGDPIELFGELGQHRGNWQFVVQHEAWTRLPAAAR